jgi:hypothetical protein
VALLSVIGGAVSLLAGESAVSPASVPAPVPAFSTAIPTVTVPLQFVQTPYAVNNVGLTLTKQAGPFTYEPKLIARAFRGTLSFGGADNQFAFIWCRDEGKLYLDLNQNRDLTDDPAGVFDRSAGSPSYYQTFTNVQLTLRSPTGTCRLVTDLEFWQFGNNSTPTCTAESHSSWQGKVNLAGEDWQVGVVPNLAHGAEVCDGDGLLLRPWSRRDEAFSTSGSTFDAPVFSRKVFFGGHAYQLRWRPGTATAVMRPALEFAEQTVPLGEVRINGKFIKRLVLGGGEYLVLGDRPAATLKVPVGNYYPPDVLLEQNGVQAYRGSGPVGMPKSVAVTGRAPTVLAVGGPLTNSVITTRQGDVLRLNYQLIGAGGETYQLAVVDRSKPPEFAIYKGHRQVASGNFEFG